MADTGIACESFFQNKINSMLVTTSWVDTLKERLGLEAVSQIWGDVPAWYFWLSDAKGVYSLQLAEAMNEEDIQMNKQGLFSIKCYPFIDTNVFNTFSYEEQLLRKSRFFDDTHTPRFEERERISDALFNVAVLEYRVPQDETMACFTLESLDTLCWVYPEETVLDVDLMNEKRCYRKGEIDRSVPGWLLGYPLFDRLLCMYAFYSKTKPVRVRITRSPGFEYLHTGSHTFQCRNTTDIHRLSASVYFDSPDKLDEEARTIQDAFLMEEEQGHVETLFDCEFPCGHFHLPEKAASLQTAEGASVNPLWWSLSETEYTSNLASTCGCH